MLRHKIEGEKQLKMFYFIWFNRETKRLWKFTFSTEEDSIFIKLNSKAIGQKNLYFKRHALFRL